MELLEICLRTIYIQVDNYNVRDLLREFIGSASVNMAITQQ
jgi:hypothetical protein